MSLVANINGKLVDQSGSSSFSVDALAVGESQLPIVPGPSPDQLATTGDWVARRFYTSDSPVPVVTAGAAAGASPVVGINGSDGAFNVSMVTGTACTTGVLFTITLGTPTTSFAPRVAFSPGNADTSALSGTTAPYVTRNSTSITFNTGTAALADSTHYGWDFVCNYTQ